MTLGSRADLTSLKPSLTPITLGSNQFFLRDLTVGETNYELYGQRTELIKLAQEQGEELPFDDEIALTAKLRNIYDKYKLARSIAIRLCDEKGQNFYDVNNQEDLDEILTLDGSIIETINKAITEKLEKNLPTADDSK